jgi:hypothetical protein
MKPDPTEDPFERKWNREVAVVAALVAIFILIGAVWTLARGPQPTRGAGGVVENVPSRITESGAVRPADTDR